MNNLEIYEKGRMVPPEAQKQFSNGKFSGTDINPMWRIKKLTELFGPAGIGWYTETISERSEQHGNVTMAIVDLNLYVKYEGEWSKPIFGTGGNILVNAKGGTSDEGYKMAYTDALGIACKALGIGADIWFGQDKTKYTNPNFRLRRRSRRMLPRRLLPSRPFARTAAIRSRPTPALTGRKSPSASM